MKIFFLVLYFTGGMATIPHPFMNESDCKEAGILWKKDSRSPVMYSHFSCVGVKKA